MEVQQPTEETLTPVIDVETLANDLLDALEQELSTRSSLETKWSEWFRLYHGEPHSPRKTTPWEDASNIVVNLAAIYVDSVQARVLGGIFGTEPHWSSIQKTRKAAPYAKPLERYMDALRTQGWKHYRVVKNAVNDVLRLGTAIIHAGWTDRMITIYDSTQHSTEIRNTHRGPTPAWVPREDFVIPEGFVAINDDDDQTRAPWIAHRQWFSWPIIQHLQSTGAIEVDDLSVLENKPDPMTDVSVTRTRREGSVLQGTSSLSGLWEFWTFWFSMDLDGDGIPEEHVLIVHRTTRTILKFKPNTNYNGFRPYVVLRFIEESGRFDGMGLPEMVEHYQEEVSTLHNQDIDNGTLANSIMLKYKKSAQITEHNKIFPGARWPVNEMDDLEFWSAEGQFRGRIQNQQFIIGLAERRVGINDVNLGHENAPIGRAPASTFAALLQEGTRRFDVSTSEIRQGLSELGEMIVDLIQMNGLPEPDEFCSPEQLLDPEEAQLLRQLFSSDDQVRGVVGLKLNVSTAAINQEVEKQSNQKLYQLFVQYYMKLAGIMQAMPQGGPLLLPYWKAQAQGLYDMMLRILHSFQTYDLEKALAGDAIQQVFASIEQQMMEQQQQPQQPPPGAGANGNGGIEPAGPPAAGPTLQ